MSKEFDIWYHAVTRFLRSQGVNEWYEGKTGGGYAIFGGPEVQDKINEFNKQYFKSSVANGVLPDEKVLNQENDLIKIGSNKPMEKNLLGTIFKKSKFRIT